MNIVSMAAYLVHSFINIYPATHKNGVPSPPKSTRPSPWKGEGVGTSG